MILNVLIGFLAIIVMVSVVKNIVSKNTSNAEILFLDKDSTNALKGFAIIMIALAHICQYEKSLKEILIGGGITYTVLFSWGAIGVSLFFLLSGYGCYLSLSKTEKYGKWLAKHIVKMLVHFVIVFIPIICIMKLVFHFDIQPIECLITFITLRLPGSTVWYFKIQILFYIILAVSMWISKNKAWMLVGALSLGYGLVADYIIGLPDYWWKTSLCFFAGCFIANYKEHVEKLLRGNIKSIWLLILGCVSYVVILKDSHYIFPVQIISYMLLAFCITMVWDWFVNGNRMLEKPGKYSLDIYLVHIGLVEGVFLSTFSVNIKVIIFAVSVAILTVLCYWVSEFLYGKIQKALKI